MIQSFDITEFNMNMKLVKYMLIAILVLGTGEVAAQVQVVSGKVTEMLGNQIEPIVGANVNIVNAQNRSVGGGDQFGW